MSTLDDKLLGEKQHYYCSSSEDEEDEPGPPQVIQQDPVPTPPQIDRLERSNSTNVSFRSIGLSLLLINAIVDWTKRCD